jgi:hypothetical protein
LAGGCSAFELLLLRFVDVWLLGDELLFVAAAAAAGVRSEDRRARDDACERGDMRIACVIWLLCSTV